MKKDSKLNETMKIPQEPRVGHAWTLPSQSAHSLFTPHVPPPGSRFTFHVSRFIPYVSLCLALAALLLAGCVAPIGADRVSTRLAYDQVDANALRTGKSSAATASLLHRYELGPLAARHPDQAVRLLHQKALDTGERDLLFALAELSYVAGEDKVAIELKAGPNVLLVKVTQGGGGWTMGCRLRAADDKAFLLPRAEELRSARVFVVLGGVVRFLVAENDAHNVVVVARIVCRLHLRRDFVVWLSEHIGKTCAARRLLAKVAKVVGQSLKWLKICHNAFFFGG